MAKYKDLIEEISYFRGKAENEMDENEKARYEEIVLSLLRELKQGLKKGK